MLQLLSLIFLSMLEDEYLVGAKLSPTLEPEAVDLAEVCGALWCCPQTSSTEAPCWFWIVPHNDITDAGVTQAQDSVVAPSLCFPAAQVLLDPGLTPCRWLPGAKPAMSSIPWQPFSKVSLGCNSPQMWARTSAEVPCVTLPRRKLRYSPAHASAVTHPVPAAFSLKLCQGRFRLYIGNLGFVFFFPRRDCPASAQAAEGSSGGSSSQSLVDVALRDIDQWWPWQCWGMILRGLLALPAFRVSMFSVFPALPSASVPGAPRA